MKILRVNRHSVFFSVTPKKMNSSNNENRLQRAIKMSLENNGGEPPAAKRRRLANNDFINRRAGRSEGATNIPWGDSHYHVPDQWEYNLKHYKDQKGVSRRSAKLVPNPLPPGPNYAPHRTIRSAKQLKNYMDLARRNSRPEASAYNAALMARTGEGVVGTAAAADPTVPNALPLGTRGNPFSLDTDDEEEPHNNQASNSHNSNHNGSLNSSHGTHRSNRSGNSAFTDNSFIDTMPENYQGISHLLARAPAVADPEVDRLADEVQAQLRRERADQIAKLRENFEQAPTDEDKWRIYRLLSPLAPNVAREMTERPDFPAEYRARLTKAAEFQEDRDVTRQDRRPQWVKNLVSDAGGSGGGSGQAPPPRANNRNAGARQRIQPTPVSNANRKGKRKLNE